MAIEKYKIVVKIMRRVETENYNSMFEYLLKQSKEFLHLVAQSLGLMNDIFNSNKKPILTFNNYNTRGIPRLYLQIPINQELKYDEVIEKLKQFDSVFVLPNYMALSRKIIYDVEW